MGRPQIPHVNDFGIFGRDHDSQNQYYLSLETPRHPINSRKKRVIIKTYYGHKTCGKSNMSNCFKRRGPKTPKARLIFLNLLNMGSISSRTHEICFGKSRIRDQYLSTKLKLMLLIWDQIFQTTRSFGTLKR